jgi:hypothetical protein
MEGKVIHGMSRRMPLISIPPPVKTGQGTVKITLDIK